METTHKLILHSFDRSGSSAIARTLSTHPDIELIFQPFNSSSLRTKMYQILSDEIITDEEKKFFELLNRNQLYEEFIVSEWHKKHSTTHEIKENKLNIIKTTINHFSVKWINDTYPNIHQWAIWRNPFEILQSILDNNFQKKWYSDALHNLIPTVKSNELLAHNFGNISPKNEVEITAYLIAVRNFFLFYHIEDNKIIDYQMFKSNPNKELSKILAAYNLKDYNFSQSAKNDLNVIGKSFNRKQKKALLPADIKSAEKIFLPLWGLYEKTVRKK
ncbi:MAG: hypothetical protein D6707_09915 [Bacteroidetes bacterium]|nr:MAG: hypothetical protein D6707_09915 [Bacteroidota bacterium]